MNTLKAYNNLIKRGSFTEDEAGAIVDLFHDTAYGQFDREAACARLVEAGLAEQQAEDLIGVAVDYYAGEFDVSEDKATH